MDSLNEVIIDEAKIPEPEKKVETKPKFTSYKKDYFSLTIDEIDETVKDVMIQGYVFKEDKTLEFQCKDGYGYIYSSNNSLSLEEQAILTHGDFDHMGEAINLVNNLKVEKVIFNYGEFNVLEQDLIKVLDKKKIPYYSCIKELNIDDNKLYFLNNKDYDNESDNSSVIYTELNNHKFLFMGDAGVEVEEDLIEKYNLQNIDVLKVGHHGSKTSSSELFINEIEPKYSIIRLVKK